jgi:hypothetical protein
MKPASPRTGFPNHGCRWLFSSGIREAATDWNFGSLPATPWFLAGWK